MMKGTLEVQPAHQLAHLSGDFSEMFEIFSGKRETPVKSVKSCVVDTSTQADQTLIPIPFVRIFGTSPCIIMHCVPSKAHSH